MGKLVEQLGITGVLDQGISVISDNRSGGIWQLRNSESFSRTVKDCLLTDVCVANSLGALRVFVSKLLFSLMNH